MGFDGFIDEAMTNVQTIIEELESFSTKMIQIEELIGISDRRLKKDDFQVGETALHHVAQVAIDLEHFEGEDVMLTQLLLDFSGDPNMPTKEVGFTDQTH